MATLGPSTAIAVGDVGTILRTDDGGVTWTRQSSGTTGPLVAVSFPDQNTGAAVGAGGTILRTDDAGATWSPQSSGTTQPLAAVSFIDANTGIVVGYPGTGHRRRRQFNDSAHYDGRRVTLRISLGVIQKQYAIGLEPGDR
jgi:photosystem II stability/assembly factor-like uncharacterized protein